MAGSSLDIAIGLIFTYLLFSLFLSTALEALAALFKLRARALEFAIKELIEDPQAPARFGWLPAKGFFGLFTIFRRTPATSQRSPSDQTVLVGDKVNADCPEAHEGPTETGVDLLPSISFDQVFRHPLVAPGGDRPSYIPTANFVTALLQTVRLEGSGSLAADVERGIAQLPDGSIRQALTSAVIEAQGDWDKLRAGVETWFDNAMDRLSGVYKRFSQAMTFILALVLACAYGLDSIGIVEKLAGDPPLRAQMVADASRYIESQGASALSAGNTAAPIDQDAAAKTQLGELDNKIVALKNAQAQLSDVSSLATSGQPNDTRGWVRYAIGLLITALAGMLDLLQKLVSLRGAGPKPDDATSAGAGAA